MQTQFGRDRGGPCNWQSINENTNCGGLTRVTIHLYCTHIIVANNNTRQPDIPTYQCVGMCAASINYRFTVAKCTQHRYRTRTACRKCGTTELHKLPSFLLAIQLHPSHRIAHIRLQYSAKRLHQSRPSPGVQNSICCVCGFSIGYFVRYILMLSHHICARLFSRLFGVEFQPRKFANANENVVKLEEIILDA